MSRRRTIFALAILGLLPVIGQSAPKDLLWQEGVLRSRKTVTVDRQVRYVYRVQGYRAQYVAVFEEPLKSVRHVPIRFAVDGRRLHVQDADGKQRSARIERIVEYSARR